MKIFERQGPICMPPTLHSLPQHNPGCYYLNGLNVFIQQNIIMQWQQRLFLRGPWLNFSKDNATLPQNQMKSHPEWNGEHTPKTFHIQLHSFEHAYSLFSILKVFYLGKFVKYANLKRTLQWVLTTVSITNTTKI